MPRSFPLGLVVRIALMNEIQAVEGERRSIQANLDVDLFCTDARQLRVQTLCEVLQRGGRVSASDASVALWPLPAAAAKVCQQFRATPEEIDEVLASIFLPELLRLG